MNEESCGVIEEESISVESDHLVTSVRDWLEVRDIMNRDVVSVGADETVISAAQKMAESAGVREQGYRLIINQGDHSGQEVPHLHLHLLAGRRLGSMG